MCETNNVLEIQSPGGVLLGIFGVGCARLLLQILTRFQTKKRNFPHPFSKTLPYVAAHTYIAYIREYPPGYNPLRGTERSQNG